MIRTFINPGLVAQMITFTLVYITHPLNLALLRFMSISMKNVPTNPPLPIDIIFTNDKKNLSIIVLHHSPLRRLSFSKFLYRNKFKPFIAAHSRPTAASPNSLRSGVSSRPECQPDVSYSQFRRPHFHIPANIRKSEN